LKLLIFVQAITARTRITTILKMKGVPLRADSKEEPVAAVAGSACYEWFGRKIEKN